jgi:hypothetical protein
MASFVELIGYTPFACCCPHYTSGSSFGREDLDIFLKACRTLNGSEEVLAVYLLSLRLVLSCNHDGLLKASA